MPQPPRNPLSEWSHGGSVARFLAAQHERAAEEERNRVVTQAAQRASIAQLMEGPLPGGGLANVSRSDIVERERDGWSRLVVVERAGTQKVARRDHLTTLWADGWSVRRQVITEGDLVTETPSPPSNP